MLVTISGDGMEVISGYPEGLGKQLLYLIVVSYRAFLRVYNLLLIGSCFVDSLSIRSINQE